MNINNMESGPIYNPVIYIYIGVKCACVFSKGDVPKSLCFKGLVGHIVERSESATARDALEL